MEARNELHRLRLATMTTQAVMAEHMGVPVRTYEDLETGKTPIRPVHVAAARWACISVQAAGLAGYALLPDEIDTAIKGAGYAFEEG